MQAESDSGVLSSRLATARALHVDHITGRIVARLREAGVRTLLLKGPALATWLYDDAGRQYTDCDLLVPPEDEPVARSVLESLGFVRDRAADHLEPRFGPLHADTWVRDSDRAIVDVHRALSGMRMGGSDVWGAMATGSQPMKVGDTWVDVPRLGGRALTVALHAAHHGEGHSQPMRDLTRAIERASFADWLDAVALAEELHAIPMLALGLRLSPEGSELADRLGLPSAALAAEAHAGSGVALGFERLAERRGLRAKLSLIISELFPSPRFMRWWTPLARRGRAGLVLAYPWRLIYLLGHALPGLRDWRRSRSVATQPSRAAR